MYIIFKKKIQVDEKMFVNWKITPYIKLQDC